LRASILRIFACGSGERTSFMCSIPGIARSSANRVSPVTLPIASTRRSGTPTTPNRRCDFWVMDLTLGAAAR
jgi:hypothetical protein